MPSKESFTTSATVILTDGVIFIIFQQIQKKNGTTYFKQKFGAFAKIVHHKTNKNEIFTKTSQAKTIAPKNCTTTAVSVPFCNVMHQ